MPLLQEEQQDPSSHTSENPTETDVDPKDPKSGKRRLFGLGKKKEAAEPVKKMDQPVMPQTAAAIQAMRPASPSKNPVDLKPQALPASPARAVNAYPLSASPSRGMRSSSPSLRSPASSSIFERNVQENASSLSSELSPAHIPSHVITEDHIPPALEATTEAITNAKLNPDEVEIVTSSTHQPAAAPVLEGSSSHADLTQLGLHQQRAEDSEHASFAHQSGILGAEDDGASNYGALDPNDVRRLSFISFADVVQAEHQQQHNMNVEGSRDSLHIIPGNVPMLAQNRAASPVRSPRSPGSTHSHSLSGGVTTPPPPTMGSVQSEQSPVRSVPSPGIGSPATQHGELTIETMRQAVRKTASGDLSGHRSAGMSPVSVEGEALGSRSRSGT